MALAVFAGRRGGGSGAGGAGWGAGAGQRGAPEHNHYNLTQRGSHKSQLSHNISWLRYNSWTNMNGNWSRSYVLEVLRHIYIHILGWISSWYTLKQLLRITVRLCSLFARLLHFVPPKYSTQSWTCHFADTAHKGFISTLFCSFGLKTSPQPHA